MKEFLPFKISKKLQEKGFKEKCLAYYTKYSNFYYNTSYGQDVENAFKSFNSRPSYMWEKRIDAPTISQVFKWLREEKKIFITINIAYCYEDDEHPFPTNPEMKPILKGYYYGVWNLDNLNDKNGRSEYFESPEQAAIAGIEYVIDNIL